MLNSPDHNRWAQNIRDIRSISRLKVSMLDMSVLY